MNVHIIPSNFTISMFSSAVGAFLTFAMLAAFVGWYKDRAAKKEAAAAKEGK